VWQGRRGVFTILAPLFFSISYYSLSQKNFKFPLIYNLLFLSIKNAGLKTVLKPNPETKSKPKPKKIG